MPDTQAGTYICAACLTSTTFFNYIEEMCKPCDIELNGCKSCLNSGLCGECLDGFALTTAGGCFDCEWHNKGCATCTADQCTGCKSNYIEQNGGMACIPKFF